MHSIGEIKTPSDVQSVFNLALREPVCISSEARTNFVLMSQDLFTKIQDDLYLAKLERSFKAEEEGRVVIKTIEELEAMTE